MAELVEEDRNVFQFLMPIVLFSESTINENSLDKEVVSDHQLHFTQLLQQYLHIQENDNEKAGAIRFGISNDLISRFREL